MEKYTKLMTTRFLEDPGVMFQVSNLERAEFLFSLQCKAQIQAFSQHNAVRLLEDGKGLLIGYSSVELPETLFLELMQQSSRELLEKATEEELLILQSKAILENEIIPQNWHLKYFDGEVFHLLVIAIDKSLKGTGAFRELLMPVIQACEKKKMPIILETFNADNVPLYEHFGFHLMESHSSDKIDLTCFCMMRWGR
ncbi:MAG TPA: GNAT family N-acetyltransferase [Syntrophomonadaceae bacterium]|nr:GNAT family N-acetyltransferase [Syntrophomonadaceae bacterium]HPR94580.1 GNAT family N-acetyltransferase [Syntrophomonadaceae bacterium]